MTDNIDCKKATFYSFGYPDDGIFAENDVSAEAWRSSLTCLMCSVLSADLLLFGPSRRLTRLTLLLLLDLLPTLLSLLMLLHLALLLLAIHRANTKKPLNLQKKITDTALVRRVTKSQKFSASLPRPHLAVKSNSSHPR